MFQVFDANLCEEPQPNTEKIHQIWREKCIICDQEVDCVGDTAQEAIIEPM